MRTTVTTDTATIVLFDPECMRHRLNEDADWWSLPQEELLEVNRANAAFLNVSADGRYQLEVAPHEELADDADVELVVRNTSGRFFFGAGEMMSSAGLEPEAEYGNVFVDAAPGSYLVRARQRGDTVTVSMTPTDLEASNSFGDLVRLGT
ncbi:DUF6386 family protein [Variovorax sp. 770b2]|uniref:DUF6386 family protein n=1 Tax=Variovorax sp. 770b2 TaxID=1566271 RepID=UPI0008E9E5F8|nr:DUF6386 family protein [Variovorax sp. 770b2]SFP51138.1 hypothetical protein SAMN03159339_2817 [Variovorax sp. 770b2]